MDAHKQTARLPLTYLIVLDIIPKLKEPPFNGKFPHGASFLFAESYVFYAGPSEMQAAVTSWTTCSPVWSSTPRTWSCSLRTEPAPSWMKRSAPRSCSTESCPGIVWPLTFEFDRATRPFIKIDRRHKAYRHEKR